MVKASGKSTEEIEDLSGTLAKYLSKKQIATLLQNDRDKSNRY